MQVVENGVIASNQHPSLQNSANFPINIVSSTTSLHSTATTASTNTQPSVSGSGKGCENSTALKDEVKKLQLTVDKCQKELSRTKSELEEAKKMVGRKSQQGAATGHSPFSTLFLVISFLLAVLAAFIYRYVQFK